MPDAIEIPLCPRPVDGSIRPPGSKSITNRAVICAALARGTSQLSGVLDSQDTRVMAAGLAALGIDIATDWGAGTMQVVGCGGRIPAAEATIDCAASGTTIRFLSAVCALGHGVYRLDGTPRMRKRPIGDLVEALRELDVEAVAESAGGCPPVAIRSHGLAGGAARVRGDTSSQFASGLALAAPCTARGMRIEFEGRLVSLPYLEMTRRVMASFGAACEPTDTGGWQIAPSGYAACDYPIEPDASAASYFFAAAAITVSGRASRGVDIDMNAISDTVPTLAVAALFADGPTTIRNVAHIRDKETDRIGDLARELRKLGATVDEFHDGLTIHPTPLHGATLDTYDDHRMAMSLALAGLLVPGVRINDPGCVGKTFPDYWRRLATIAKLDTAHWPK